MAEACELPLDILIKIFKKLPIESLIRCTSLSKQLKSIIKSSKFINDYNNSHIQPSRLFVAYRFQNYVDLFDDDNDDVRFLQRLNVLTSAKHTWCFDLIGYSQGLFGFRLYSYDDDDSDIVIWNPSIRKSVFIPVPQQQSFKRTHFVFTVVSNATDPMIFNICDNVDSEWLLDIFTLSTGVWRTLDIVSPRKSLQLTYKNGVVINRFIHWIVYDTIPMAKMILSFDMTNEQFTEVCLPDNVAPNADYADKLHLSNLRESLVVLREELYEKEIGVWMMMEPGVENSIKKLYTIRPPYVGQFPKLLGFRKNGQPIIYSDFRSSKKVLLFYECDMERFNDIEVLGVGYPSTADSYMETLLLLDH